MNRIAIIGNAAGGKSTLARALSRVHNIPLLVIDHVQFTPNWGRADEADVFAAQKRILANDRWIIDGFGPWPSIEERFERADTVILIDYPLQTHCTMAAERQVASALGKHLHEAPGCRFVDVTRRMFESIFRVHEQIRPKILASLQRYRMTGKVITITSPEELDRLAEEKFQLGADWRKDA
ncbi:DNA topology modulation protein [soil metagenome]